MATVTITDVKPEQVSDGYHTIAELYEHRHALFLSLMRLCPDRAWWSEKHHDGSGYPGWLIAGVHLPTGDVTYHLPEKLKYALEETKARKLDRAPEWDGHTSAQVLQRLMSFARGDYSKDPQP